MRRDFLAAHVIGEDRSRVGRCRQRCTLDQRLLGHFGHGGKLQRLIRGHGAVQRIGHRQGPDQNQHDQPHAFLTVIGAVGEGHAGAGQDQQAANPPRRRNIALGLLVQRAILDEGSQGQEQQCGAAEADQWREQQGVTDLGRLRPVHTAGAVAPVHQGIGYADSDDRADQGVR
ncbi:hypothetical protein D3C76_906520 [compost metagenome]